mmetsp:Transcript_8191/g.20705  ORF Transcript_8191/g.20705 Transcript_8191/m.20705 type:complete len:98 (-) Transcript_8191:179-472(-)
MRVVGTTTTTTTTRSSHYSHSHEMQMRFKPEQVIDRLTEHITDRLRDELRVELQRDWQQEQADMAESAAATGQHVEGLLALEIASHTCPICYDLRCP